MTTDDVRELGRRFVDEYAGGGDANSASTLLAEDFEAYVPARDEPIRGRDAHVAMNASWHQAIPDFSYTLESIVADGNQVVVRFSWSGTHTGGELMGVHPTGRCLNVASEVHWLEAKDGRLIRDHALMNLGGIVEQLKSQGDGPE